MHAEVLGSSPKIHKIPFHLFNTVKNVKTHTNLWAEFLWLGLGSCGGNIWEKRKFGEGKCVCGMRGYALITVCS